MFTEEADKGYIVSVLAERQRVILHARAASQVPEHEHAHVQVSEFVAWLQPARQDENEDHHADRKQRPRPAQTGHEPQHDQRHGHEQDRRIGIRHRPVPVCDVRSDVAEDLKRPLSF